MYIPVIKFSDAFLHLIVYRFIKYLKNQMLSGVEFSVWKEKDIRKASVVHVFEKKTTEKGVPIPNGLRDPKMGPFHSPLFFIKTVGRC